MYVTLRKSPLLVLSLLAIPLLGIRVFLPSLSATNAVTAAAAAAAAEKPSQVVHFAIQQEPPQLNAMKATDQQSFFVLGHVIEGLTRYGKGNEPVPGVAEKWEITDQGATFHLRKNAKWSDGKGVTALDFIFAWKTALDPKTASEYAFILYPIRNAERINQGKLPESALGVSAPDDRTLKIAFEKPCGYFLALTSFSTFGPVREDFYLAHKDRYGADATDLLYNGPYVLSQWVHGASLKLDRNPYYWNRDRIAIDQIDIPYITADNSALFNFYKDHKTDLIERMGKDDLPKAQADGFKMKSFADGSVWYLEFNFRDGRVTRNRNLRKAIQLVFNRDEFVSRVVGIPGTKPATTLIPTSVKGVKDAFRREYPFSPPKASLAEARKYLAVALKELGLSSPPSLVWLTGDTPLSAREAEYFQSVLKSTLGIELRIDRQIFKQRLAKMLSGEFDIVSAGWGPDYSDPMTFAELKATWNENNRGRYSSPQVDAWIRKAQATSDAKRRMDAMAEAEKLILDDLAVLPTYERSVVYVNSDRLQGLVRHAIGTDPDFTFAHVLPETSRP